jgi:hypothetical protein
MLEIATSPQGTCSSNQHDESNRRKTRLLVGVPRADAADAPSFAAPAQTYLARNASYASTFTSGHLPLPPSKRIAVVVCMDARIDPAAALGIELGDAHVIRNGEACGVDRGSRTAEGTN